MISALSSTSTLSAQHALMRNQRSLSDVFTRLSTGRKINAGKDNPAGLISSEQLSSAIAALEAETNALRRTNYSANISDGHMSQVSSMMGELNALVVAGANTAGMSDAEIQATQLEIDSLVSSIQRFSGDAVTSMDGMGLGGHAEDVRALVNGAATSLSALTSGGSSDLSSGNIDAAQTLIQTAITDANTARGTIGAYQKNTLDPTIRANGISIENLSAARSRIRDTNYAEETSNLAKFEVLTESNMKVLKIAQQQAGSVLALLS